MQRASSSWSFPFAPRDLATKGAFEHFASPLRKEGANLSHARADEGTEPGRDLLAPAPAAEGAVMADVRLQMVLPAIVGDRGAERVRGAGLADAGDVVLAALDGEQRGVADRLGPHRPAAVQHPAHGQ